MKDKRWQILVSLDGTDHVAGICRGTTEARALEDARRRLPKWDPARIAVKEIK